MTIDYAGKAVIVTGGAQGIGRGAVLEFAASGARVAVVDRDRAAGEQTAAEAASHGQEAVFIEADMGVTADCRRAVNEAVAAFGGVDVLFNNVGMQGLDSYRNAEDTSEELWDRIIAVNLKSHFLMAKFCIPEMRKRGGGVIVNNASVQGLQSMPKVPPYAASKGGVLSLTRNLALDYAKENIRVLAVCPGSVDTPLLREAARAEGDEEQMIATWDAAQPLQRIGRPADIGKAVVFLASDQASWMTGEYVCVDGGVMATGAWAPPVSQW